MPDNSDMNSRFMTFSGWVFGLASLILTVYVWQSTLPKGELVYELSDRVLYEPSTDIPTSLSIFAERGDVNKTVFENTLKLWHVGNISVESTDVRTPVVINVPSGEEILKPLISRVRSSLPNNFWIESISPSRLSIKWSVFDPDMAVEIKFLSSINKDEIGLEGNFGPQSSVRSAYIVPPWLRGTVHLLSVFFIFLFSAKIGEPIVRRIFTDRRIREVGYKSRFHSSILIVIILLASMFLMGSVSIVIVFMIRALDQFSEVPPI